MVVVVVVAVVAAMVVVVLVSAVLLVVLVMVLVMVVLVVVAWTKYTSAISTAYTCVCMSNTVLRCANHAHFFFVRVSAAIYDTMRA